MNSTLQLVALAMLVIGPIQFLWALIKFLTTDSGRIVTLLKRYLIGVVVYFLVLFILLYCTNLEHFLPILGVHFFGSAGLLFCFHLYIVARYHWMVAMPATQDPDIDFENSELESEK